MTACVPSPAVSGSNLGLLVISASPRLRALWKHATLYLPHERDRAAEERNARQRRVNEAEDSVPGSQDALVETS